MLGYRLRRLIAINTKATALTSASEVPEGLSALSGTDPRSLLAAIEASLDDDKAEDVVVIDLSEKSSFADYMVIASGRSSRHVISIVDHLQERLKAAGCRETSVEGLPQADWVFLDAGDVVVHVFRPEIREFYNLEKMWGAASLLQRTQAQAAELQA